MPYLVRENLFISNINDAAQILQNAAVQYNNITHILSVLSSASISFFSEWRSTISIPVKEISKLHVSDLPTAAKSALSPDKLLYSLEYAGKDLKLVRMAVPLKDTESENLLDYLEVCIDFIDRSRKEGSVLVHCFAGVSRRFQSSLSHFNFFFQFRFQFCCCLYWNYCVLILRVDVFSLEGFTCVFMCSASVITAYLMRSENLSLEGVKWNQLFV